jgi:hypothetical protein
MKRSYISPEYAYTNVSGLLNMSEESTFFGSKMMKLPTNILVGNTNISYYQNELNEQINYVNEVVKYPVVINVGELKSRNHVIYKDDSVFDNSGQTSWVVEISLFDILSTYAFGNIKSNRTFEGILNSSLDNNDVDLTIREYVAYNIVNLYELKSISLYLQYNDLVSGLGMVGVNKFNIDVSDDTTINISNMVFNSDKSIVKIYFKQAMDSGLFSFDYFFNLNFMKI